MIDVISQVQLSIVGQAHANDFQTGISGTVCDQEGQAALSRD